MEFCTEEEAKKFLNAALLWRKLVDLGVTRFEELAGGEPGGTDGAP